MILKKSVKTIVLITNLIILFSFPVPGMSDSSVNLLGYLKYAVKFETRTPYYLKKARRLFFKEGWDTDGPFPRAIGREAIFAFYASAKKTMKVAVNIENNNFPGIRYQLNILLYINGHPVDRLKIKAKKYSVFLLPERYIRSGMNKLTFSIKSNTPVHKNRMNCFPGVWFILKNIELLDFPDIGNEFTNLNDLKIKKFYQPSNSFFEIVVDTAKVTAIQFNSEILKKNNKAEFLYVKKTDSKGKSSLLLKQKRFYRKSVSTRIDFNSGEGKIILSFSFKSPLKNAFLLWKKFELNRIKNDRVVKKIVDSTNRHLRNIFVIVLDALRFDVVGKKVDGIEITRNINDFANVSYNFKNYYVNAPYTGASIATMFTGLLPEVHTVRKIGSQVPSKIKMLQSCLKKSGFILRGFTGNPVLLFHDLFKGYDSTKLIYALNHHRKKPSSFNDIKPVIQSILKIDKSKKHFYYIHLLPPHKPYCPPSPFNTRFYRGDEIKNSGFEKYSKDYIKYKYLSYLNNASYGDALVGEILKQIKKKKLFNESLIVITSDHGEAFAEHHVMEHGTTVYNEMVHVPFLIKSPFQDTGMVVESQCSHLNFASTVLSFLGLRFNSDFGHQPIDFETSKNTGDIYSRATGRKINAMVMSGKYKYIFNSGLEALFNIEEDSDESENMIDFKKYKKLLLKQKLFSIYFNNLEQKLLRGIRLRIRKIKNWDSELKTLGYL